MRVTWGREEWERGEGRGRVWTELGKGGPVGMKMDNEDEEEVKGRKKRKKREEGKDLLIVCTTIPI